MTLVTRVYCCELAATSVSVDGGTYIEQSHCYYARDPEGLHVLMSLLTYGFLLQSADEAVPRVAIRGFDAFG